MQPTGFQRPMSASISSTHRHTSRSVEGEWMRQAKQQQVPHKYISKEISANNQASVAVSKALNNPSFNKSTYNTEKSWRSTNSNIKSNPSTRPSTAGNSKKFNVGYQRGSSFQSSQMQANNDIMMSNAPDNYCHMKSAHDQLRTRQGTTTFQMGNKNGKIETRKQHNKSFDHTKQAAGTYKPKVQAPRHSMASHITGGFSQVNSSREKGNHLQAGCRKAVPNFHYSSPTKNKNVTIQSPKGGKKPTPQRSRTTTARSQTVKSKSDAEIFETNRKTKNGDAYVSQTHAYFQTLKSPPQPVMTKAASSKNSSNLWNSSGVGSKQRETRSREKINTFNSSFTSDKSNKTSINPSTERMLIGFKYSNNDTINSNFIDNVDLRYHSKANWHNQGPLSHDVLIPEDPKRIEKSANENHYLNKKYKQNLLETHHKDGDQAQVSSGVEVLETKVLDSTKKEAFSEKPSHARSSKSMHSCLDSNSDAKSAIAYPRMMIKKHQEAGTVKLSYSKNPKNYHFLQKAYGIQSMPFKSSETKHTYRETMLKQNKGHLVYNELPKDTRSANLAKASPVKPSKNTNPKDTPSANRTRYAKRNKSSNIKWNYAKNKEEKSLKIALARSKKTIQRTKWVV
ncbi:unnamed protein product [Moneuplotes crassus]|uniref:Uncharacterized protein n=1 Tax=Euplotes crassus TaxID=5936 RepID=A0AAD1U2X3_EUPCR|nr:unnamed protein product [Moneuplotes crassus]